MKPSFFARYGIYIMAVCLFLLPFAVIGAVNAKKKSKNDVKNWIPPEYDETKIFTAFRQLYKGGDEFILVSWDGCTRENQRLVDLALKTGPQVEVLYQHEETGVRAVDVELAKLDIEEKYQAEFKAERVKQAATDDDSNTEVPKLVYSDTVIRDENYYTYAFRSAEDMGENPKEPNRNRAYATIVVKPTTYFSKVSTGPRVMDQIIRSNGGKMSREVVADKLAGSLFGPGFKTKDEKTGQWQAVHKSKLETITDAEGKETEKLVHRDPDTNKVLPDNKVVPVPVDERQTCMLVNLSETGIAKKKEAIDELRNIAINQCKIPADSLRIGGPAVDNVAIDDAGQKSLNTLAGLAVVIGAIVSWFSLRSYKLVVIVLASGIYASVLSLSVVWWTGAPVDAILFTMPSLVYVATTSGAIHLSNYYRDVILEGGSPSGAGGKALHHAALPLGLATGTTAVGLATLCITELVPIYNFGLYSAIGVLVSALLLIFLIPAALELWQPTIHRPKTIHIDHNETHSYIDQSCFWWRAGQWVLRHGKIVSVCCLLVMGLAGYGLFYGETSVQLLRLLSPRERVIADYGFLEDKIGPLVPMEVVVRIPVKNGAGTDAKSASANTDINFYQRLQLIDSIRHRVESINEVGSTMSTLTFMESLDTIGNGLPNSIRDRVINSRLLKHREEFLANDYLREEVHKDGKVYSRRPGGHLRELENVEAKPELEGQTFEVWRISARVSALKNVDYALFISNLKENVEPEVDDYLLYVQSTQKNATEATVSAAEMNLGLTNLLPPWVDRADSRMGIHTQYTGVVPLVYKAQHSLMDGLVWGFLTDFALIVIVMMIACRDWSAGIVLLLPSAFPAVVVFGTMGWLHHFLKSRGIGNLYIDIGYVMAPSVALGVTVDDVVHFMLWFRKGISEGMNRKESVELALRGCARAMYQSWGVIGIGLSIFALSAFMPTRNFGIMMISMLTVALAGNLLMLPAILVGPGGAVFAWGVLRKENRKRRKAGLHEIHSHAESYEPTIVEGDGEEVPTPAPQIQIATEAPAEVAATATEHDYDDDIVTVRLPNVTGADPAQSTPSAPHAAKSDSLRRTFRRK